MVGEIIVEPKDSLCVADFVDAGICLFGVVEFCKRHSIDKPFWPVATLLQIGGEEDRPHIRKAAGLDGNSYSYGSDGGSNGCGNGDGYYGNGYGHGDGSGYGNSYGNGSGDNYRANYGDDNIENHGDDDWWIHSAPSEQEP